MINNYADFYHELENYLARKVVNHHQNKRANSPFMSYADLNGYFANASSPIPGQNGVLDIRYLFLRFCFHAQNATVISGVIKFEDNYQTISDITHNFDINYVLVSYSNYRDIATELSSKLNKPLGKTIVRYAKAIYSAAKYLNQFPTYNTFIDAHLHYGELAPTAIGYNVDGMKDTLACDFLKEVDARFDICKPDVHVKKCISRFCDLESATGDRLLYLVRKNCTHICDQINALIPGLGLTVYKLDKMLYLICTEHFYMHDKIKNHGSTKREIFIDHLINLRIVR